jgi:hypothetical protein
MSHNNKTSYAEIQKILEPRIEELRRQTVYAVYNDPPSPPLRFLTVVAGSGATSSRSSGSCPAPKIPLAEEHFLFLCDARDFPEDGLKQRYERLQVGMGRGNRLLRELKNAGYVTVAEIPSQHPAGGRGRIVASLTRQGMAFITAFQQTTTSSKKS